MSRPFTIKTLRLLRGLKRNTDRARFPRLVDTPTPPPPGDYAGIPADGEYARWGAPVAGAARVPGRSSRGALSAIQAVPGRPGIRRRVRDEPRVLSRAGRHLPRG